MSVARPLSVSVYAPALAIVRYESADGHGLHPRAAIPTAAWSIPVAVQNRITRSCALSLVVALCRSDKHLDDLARMFGPYIRGWIAMAHSGRQLLANATEVPPRTARLRGHDSV
jgi:hypothetical protein